MALIELSPVLVGIFGVTAGVLMVTAFHCIKVCLECDDGRRTRTASAPPRFPPSRGQNIGGHNREDASSNSRSFSTVRLLIASNYSKECKEETCSVCLSGFNQGDEVRILPGCAHVFHVLCIDKWLLSHSNCPICRADVFTAAAPNSGCAGGGRRWSYKVPNLSQAFWIFRGTSFSFHR